MSLENLAGVGEPPSSSPGRATRIALIIASGVALGLGIVVAVIVASGPQKGDRYRDRSHHDYRHRDQDGQPGAKLGRTPSPSPSATGWTRRRAPHPTSLS